MKGAYMVIRMKNNHQATVSLAGPPITYIDAWLPGWGKVFLEKADRDGHYHVYTNEEWEIEP